MPNDEVKLPVIVKPLEWINEVREGDYFAIEAQTIATVYFIVRSDATDGEYSLSSSDGKLRGYFAALDAAQAAAQLDHETRIRKELLPPLGDGRAEIVEAVRVTPEAIDAICTELRLWHDCMDGSGPGDGRFRISDVPDPEQHRLNFRGTLRDAIKMIRSLSNPGGGLS